MQLYTRCHQSVASFEQTYFAQLAELSFLKRLLLLRFLSVNLRRRGSDDKCLSRRAALALRFTVGPCESLLKFAGALPPLLFEQLGVLRIPAKRPTFVSRASGQVLCHFLSASDDETGSFPPDLHRLNAERPWLPWLSPPPSKALACQRTPRGRRAEFGTN